MKIIAKIAVSAALLAVSPLAAFAAAHSAAPAAAGTAGAEAGNKVNGEVRKVDMSAKKITIKHEELKHLDMPAMTMVFQVRDPSVLDNVNKGDKVEFVAEKIGGQFVVTEIGVKQ